MTIPIVSFYTKDTPYQAEAERMKASAESMGLHRIHLFQAESQGSWEANCQMKAEVILNAAERLKIPFLYVDADARFLRFPTLFDLKWNGDYDFGVHYFRGTELLSGTIWVNPTTHTLRLLCDWINVNEKMPTQWDQKNLERALQMQTNKLRVLRLPPEYTWIYDLSPQQYGPLNPVVEHLQASRKYKRTIK